MKLKQRHKLQGKITKFFDDKKYGFIQDTEKQSRFFHITECLNPNEIRIGASVQFEPFSEQKGLVAKAVSVIE